MPKLEFAQGLADIFNVSLDYLTGKTDIKTRNETTQGIHKATGLSEKACETLVTLCNHSCSYAFVDDLLQAPSDMLEKIGKKYIAYLHVEQSLSPVIERKKTELEGRRIIADITINGEKLPQVPIQDLSDYTKYELYAVLRLQHERYSALAWTQQL